MISCKFATCYQINLNKRKHTNKQIVKNAGWLRSIKFLIRIDPWVCVSDKLRNDNAAAVTTTTIAPNTFKPRVQLFLSQPPANPLARIRCFPEKQRKTNSRTFTFVCRNITPSTAQVTFHRTLTSRYGGESVIDPLPKVFHE